MNTTATATVSSRTMQSPGTCRRHQRASASGWVLIPGLVALVVVGLATACTSQRRGTDSLPDRFDILYRENGSESEDVLEAPVDSIWRLLPAVYQETGFAAAPATRGTAHIYFTPHLEIVGGRSFYPGERTSLYMDCGSAPGIGLRADSYEVTFVIMTRLTPVDGGHTRVQTLIDGHARPRGSSGHSVPCVGTGRLEKHIADSLRRRANLPRSPSTGGGAA